MINIKNDGLQLQGQLVQWAKFKNMNFKLELHTTTMSMLFF